MSLLQWPIGAKLRVYIGNSYSPDDGQRMKIAIIAHNLSVAGGKSVGQNIVAQLPVVAPDHDYLMIVPRDCGYKAPESPRVKVIDFQSTSRSSRMRFELKALPELVRDFQPDWIWGLGNLGLLDPPCRQSVLFHDPHLVYPESFYASERYIYKMKKRLLKRRLAKCLPKTTSVYCQTQTARKRFSETFDYDIEQIGICPNAVSAFTLSEMQPLPEGSGLDQSKFILFTLTKCYGHKNLDGIAKMYREHGSQLADTQNLWTIEKNQHPIAKTLLKAISEPGMKSRIHNLGPLSQQQLGSVFQASGALFLPTFLESFSGTYLEAMHFGVPIITSDLDFAHEVCGDAAIYVDPWDTVSMKDGIRLLVDSPGLADEMVLRGKQRLKSLFRSWPEILAGVLEREGVDYIEV